MKYLSLAPLLLLALLVGCGPPSNASIIKKTVNEANAASRSIVEGSEGMFTEAKAFQDGEKEGIVFEYTVNDKGTVKKEMIDADKIRKELLTNPKIKIILERGIHQTYRYQTKDGEVWAEVKLTKSDL